jgi:hypothetical protein
MIYIHISKPDKTPKNVHKFFQDAKKPADIAGFFMPVTLLIQSLRRVGRD